MQDGGFAVESRSLKDNQESQRMSFRVNSWMESLPAANDPPNHTKDHEEVRTGGNSI